MIAASLRAVLDRRMAEERCVALDPPFERPDWFWQIHGLSFVPNAFVMDRSGALSRRWIKADEVDWSRAVAVRFETPGGKHLSLEELLSDDDDYY